MKPKEQRKALPPKMTESDAFAEARRRWGPQAWVQRGANGLCYVYDATLSSSNGRLPYIGSGQTWEFAFRYVDELVSRTTTASVAPKPGYHTREIKRGVLGEPSKIREELDELEDAIEQGNTILAHCELADLYGALESVAEEFGLTMEHLRLMSDATKRAFQSGERK